MPSSNQRLNWSDIITIYNNLNTQRQRFSMSTVAVPNNVNYLATVAQMQELKNQIEGLSTHNLIGSIANTGVTLPAVGSLIKPLEYNLMQETLDDISAICIHFNNFTADYSPHHAANFTSDNSPHHAANFTSDNSPHHAANFTSDHSPHHAANFTSDHSPHFNPDFTDFSQNDDNFSDFSHQYDSNNSDFNQNSHCSSDYGNFGSNHTFNFSEFDANDWSVNN